MNVLVLGASGATGRLLVKQLLDKEINTFVIVRSKSRFEKLVSSHPKLSVLEGEILNLPESELSESIRKSDVVVSCLGHTLSFKGVFGQPRRLVTEAVKRVTKIHVDTNRDKTLRFILMNTSGNCNHQEHEVPPLSQRAVVFLLRYLLPPHADNECAATYLCSEFGDKKKSVEWVAVRPDALIDDHEVSKYKVFPSPIRNAIFNSGKSSRINVANFIKELILEKDLWAKWSGRMPVLYNHE